MYHLGNSILSLSLAFGISLLALNAQAAPPANDEPTAADLKNSRERMFLKPLYPASKPPASDVKIKTPVINKKTNTAVSKPKTTGNKTNTTTSILATQNSTQGLTLSAWLNRSGQPPTYKVGDKLQVNVKASKDCNITVFDFDDRGTITQIFPNDYQPSSLLRAGEVVAIGGPDSQFDYEISGSGGSERIFVYAYPVGVDNPVTVAFHPQTNSPFRSGNLSLDDYRKLVNDSKNYFSREVKIVPKSGIKPAALPGNLSPNKIELPFLVSPH